MKIVAEKILLECMGYKKEESLLIVTDDVLIPIADIFFKTAMGLKKGECILMKIKPVEIHGQEPPEIIGKTLRMVDIALLITQKSLSHTKARKRATDTGVRIASMPGISIEMMKRCMDINYKKLRRNVNKWVRRLSRFNKIQILSSAGTDLTFSIKGRKGFADDGIYTKTGAFGNLPAGEACIAPVEKSANGIIVIDASFAGIGKLEKPIILVVKNGYVKSINSRRLTNIVKPFGRQALNIAEFGIGLNPKAKVTGNVLEDEKAIDTAHIAIGDNRSFGGKVSAQCHLDGVLYSPEIIADGVKLR